MGSSYLRYTIGTLKYRQFFSILALASGASTSLGLVLSLPTTFSVIQVHADTTGSTTTASLLSPVATDTKVEIAALAPQPLISRADETLLATSTPIVFLKKALATTSIPNVAGVNLDSVFTVPFYSQFTDITAPTWKKVACGITSLAMLIEYYYPNKIDSVDTLLHEGITAGAYDDAAGWSYNGLITVAKKYGLNGSTHDYKDSTMDVAFKAFSKDLLKGPIMASVHYTFKASNPIPHLVIVSGIKDGLVYYNDPAAPTGGGSISIAQFKEGWKKRYIEFYEAA
jgi:predicted double-glycine peptidase